MGDGCVLLERAGGGAAWLSAKGLSYCPNAGWSNERLARACGCRRLNKDYELLLQTAEIFVYLAISRIMVKRLA